MALLFQGVIKAQVTFEKIISKNNYAWGMSVVQTRDGGYAFLAYLDYALDSSWLVKTDASGDTLWTRSFYKNAGLYFNDRALVSTADGGFTFPTYRNGTTNLLHVSPTGDSLWEKTICQGLVSILAPTSGNGYIVAGSGNETPWDMTVCRTDSAGNVLWKKDFVTIPAGEWVSPRCYAIKEIPGGDFIIGGGIESGYFTFLPFLFRIGPTGDSLWFREYQGYGDACFYSLDTIGEEGFYAGGTEMNRSMIMKLNSSGDSLWTRVHYHETRQNIYSIQTTTEGDVIVCGDHYTGLNSHPTELMLMKYGSNSDSLWGRYFGNYYEAFGHSVAHCTDGGWIICGGAQSTSDDDYHALLIKTDKNGNMTGIGDTQSPLPGISVYPNPASDKIMLVFKSSPEKGTYEIVDMAGRISISGSINRMEKQKLIDVRTLSTGVWFIKINTESGFLQICKILIASTGTQ